MKKAKKIVKKLKKAGVVGATGEIQMTLLDVSFNLSEKSALGDIIQEWLRNWFISEDIYHRTNPNTQEPPDFYLSESNLTDLLEVKVFDYSASPNFDVANFDTYIRALQNKTYKLDVDYLIFGYRMENSVLKIEDIWLKKIWEICRSSERFPINTQCKQGKIVNIRPAKWYASKSSSYPIFNSRGEFVNALNATIQSYEHLSSDIDKRNWLEIVTTNYRETTNSELFE